MVSHRGVRIESNQLTARLRFSGCATSTSWCLHAGRAVLRGKAEPKRSHWTEIRLYRLEDDKRGTLAAAVVHRTAFPDETDVFRAVIRDTGTALSYELTEANKHWWDTGEHRCHICRHPLFGLIEKAFVESGWSLEQELPELAGLRPGDSITLSCKPTPPGTANPPGMVVEADGAKGLPGVECRPDPSCQ